MVNLVVRFFVLLNIINIGNFFAESGFVFCRQEFGSGDTNIRIFVGGEKIRADH